MTTTTLYSASVPTFARQLGSMRVWLDRAEAHAQTKGFPSANYLGLRFAPDMLPFVKQVQIACDAAKFCVARLSGAEAPAFADDEASLADLQQRIQATIDFVQSVPADRIVGAEDKEISVPRRTGAIVLTGDAYAQRFGLPNFWFHVTTTYALLRAAGVDLGKADFLGPLQ